MKKDDEEIVDMLFSRNEQALSLAEDSYGALCRKVAFGILGDYDYAAECVNTVLYKLWNAVPPARPESLKAYLCKMVRNEAFSMRKENASSDVCFTELSELFPDGKSAEDVADGKLLAEHLNEFLKEQREINRRVFILRYYYNLSIEEISVSLGIKRPTVKTKLFRMREELKEFLAKKGYNIQKGQ